VLTAELVKLGDSCVRMRATQPEDVVARSAQRVVRPWRGRAGDRHTISVSGAAGATVSVQPGG